jgi:hypothetical protein
MTLFEAMTAFSVALAIGIPAFMDKVMRPKYEDRFEEFRKARRDTFLDEFESAHRKLKQAKEEIAPETAEAMEGLFEKWGQLKGDENRLKRLLFLRKFLYLGWFTVSGLCLLSIQFSEDLIGQTNVSLGQVTSFSFGVMFFFSLWYGYSLFDLDDQLSKFKGETTGETFGKSESVRVTYGAYVELEHKVEITLDKFNIPFAKNAMLKTDKGMVTEVDFVVPSSQNPKYAIEIKSKPRMQFLYELSLRFNEMKSSIPLKTILVSDFKGASENTVKTAKAYWDYVVDFEELDKLKEIIQL